MKIKKKALGTLDLSKKIRGSWYGVNPVTKVIPDKTKYVRSREKLLYQKGSDD